jgi:ribose 5-phosphate isomerase RpiB
MSLQVKYPAGKVYFGSDEHNYDLKDKIKQEIELKGYLVVDLGVFDIEETVSYDVLAREVAEKVLENEDACEPGERVSLLHGCKSVGIIIGNSGVALLTAVRSMSGITASLCTSVEMARNAKNKQMNMLCIGTDEVNAELAEQIILEYLSE